MISELLSNSTTLGVTTSQLGGSCGKWLAWIARSQYRDDIALFNGAISKKVARFLSAAFSLALLA